jgi:hypothetical protein
MLSQHSKVLFVNEPQMIRAAVVHFASNEDLERAWASFRNTEVLGSVVDIVPVCPSRFEGLIFLLSCGLYATKSEDAESDIIMASHAFFCIQP